MGNARRVQGDRALGDALSRHEVPARVVEDLVAVHVGVEIRDGDCVGVEIEGSRHEVAQRQPLVGEQQVRRRREVDAPNPGVEVAQVDGEGKEMAVPADDVEGMAREHLLEGASPGLQNEPKLPPLVARRPELRNAQIALAVGRGLDELARAVAVVRGDLEGLIAFDDEELVALEAFEGDLVGRAPRDHELVALREADGTELAPKDALAAVDEEVLVRPGVSEEHLAILRGARDGDAHVLAGEERPARGDEVARSLHPIREQMQIGERRLGPDLGRRQGDLAGAQQLGR
jgi:hypothetical protein